MSPAQIAHMLKRAFISALVALTALLSVSLPERAEAALPADVVQTQAPNSALVWHYPKRFEPAVAKLRPKAELSMKRLEQRLALTKPERVDIWLISDLDDFYTWNELPSRAPEWAVGLSLVNKRTVLVKHGVGKDGQLVDLEKTLDHELAHVAVDLARQGKHMPLWFNEGFAQWHAQEWTLENGELVARSAASHTLQPLSALDRSFPDHHNSTSIAYAQSHHFIRYLVNRYGEDFLPQVMSKVRQGESFSVAFTLATGDDFENVQTRWMQGLEQNSSVLSVFADGTLLFFGASLLFLLTWGVRRRRSQLKFETLDDDLEDWGYDVQRYPLPRYTPEQPQTKEVWRALPYSS